jgi:FkbH-like protein
MKLTEALAAVARARDLPVTHQLFVACGFELLHLPAFLEAHHQARFPGGRLAVSGGRYGDLLGNLARAASSPATVAVLLIEWGDLDPRLGLRSTAPWSGPAEQQIRVDLQRRLDLLHEATLQLAGRMPVVLMAPSIPLLLVGRTPGWQMSGFELELEQMLAAFLGKIGASPSVRVIHPHRLAALSPPASRHDPAMELGAGFPFRVEHADVVAQAVLALAFPAAPRKGLITDLDDTLWAGIVGEVGPGGISWSQADHAQLHGLYQSVLRQLAEAGVLLAIATKNDPAVVEAALAREDLHLPREAFFPVYAGWGPKSAAVSAILASWNLAADSVVFVDDSRMELEEVKRVHPGILGLELGGRDARQTLAVLAELRELFGKPTLVAEDRLRSTSVRAMAAFKNDLAGQDTAAFVKSLGGRVVFDRPSPAGPNLRLLELVNKTNQFNLNGARVSEGEWLRFLGTPGSRVAAVSYRDRYGDLGIIGVIAGLLADEALAVKHWVLSCRAFSRQIEEHMLHYMFELAAGKAVQLMYRKTDRNQPLQEFLAQLDTETGAQGTVVVSLQVLERLADRLPHQVQNGSPAGDGAPGVAGPGGS